MKRNAMSLKAIINNIAKENNVLAQSVLQTYMLERLLERISISKYKNNFILKGGILISAMLGIDSRTTMDMDTTIKGFKLTEENISKIINEICNISIDDDVSFEVKKIELIREDIVYLFGHNHSGNYDDYIGGSINYIGSDSIMQIGGTNEPVNINFTYLNAGYLGYTNNLVTDHSVKENSTTSIKVGLDNLLIQKYTKYGEYYKEPIVVNLKNK